MFAIAICDDCAQDILRIRELLMENQKRLSNIRIDEYRSGEELIENIGENHDLIILDIQMDGMDGNETAKRIRKFNKDAVLVFYSGVYHPTVDSFVVQPFRYLMKNLPEERLRADIAAIWEEVKTRFGNKYLLVKYNGKIIRVDIMRILYIEKRKHGSIIHLLALNGGHEDQSAITNERLFVLYDKLVDLGFEYSHNSYIVNLKKIMKIDKNEIILEGNVQLSISRAKKRKFKTRLLQVLTK